MCVDYRALNRIMVRDRYPIRLIPDLLDRLRGANVFSELDLKTSYWQVRIADGEEQETAHTTLYSTYEFLVMTFGLTNVSATFCQLMNQVLAPCLDDFVVVYLDNIIVYSSSLDEHERHIRMVLSKL